MESYDSSKETLEHIKLVNSFLIDFATELLKRAKHHDTSKLGPNEKPYFDVETPLLKNLSYGSPEYFESLERLKPALEHHYANNPHHPQFYESGIDGMNLWDIVEMFVDWKAAVERTEGGDINKSLEINSKRYNMSEQLVTIFKNTIETM